VNASFEKILDLIPELMEKANDTFKKKIKVKKDLKGGGKSERSEEDDD
jgi:uncharacterized spore protein YtfJ